MPSLCKETIEELQQIIAQEYRRKVTFGEAQEIASGLTGYFDLLAKIQHRMQTNEQLNCRENEN